MIEIKQIETENCGENEPAIFVGRLFPKKSVYLSGSWKWNLA
jgi:hypothetical protein